MLLFPSLPHILPVSAGAAPSLNPETLEANTQELSQHPETSVPTSTSHSPSTHLLSLPVFTCFSPDTMKAVFLLQ